MPGAACCSCQQRVLQPLPLLQQARKSPRPADASLPPTPNKSISSLIESMSSLMRVCVKYKYIYEFIHELIDIYLYNQLIKVLKQLAKVCVQLLLRGPPINKN